MTALKRDANGTKGCSYLTCRSLLDVNLPGLCEEQIPQWLVRVNPC